MHSTHPIVDGEAFAELMGARAWRRLQGGVNVPSELRGSSEWAHPSAELNPAQAAMALGLILLGDLCERVPFARAYVQECAESGRPLVFDHGAMRTVRLEVGGIPSGRLAVARLLEPLGYCEAKAYPLDRLGMTGFVYTHAQFPELLPQYFVSELYPELFSAELQDAAERLLATSVDPLPAWAEADLVQLQYEGALPLAQATRMLHAVAACFDRYHDDVSVADYETFRKESAEMAWIATEGHAFNHITDRVADVHMVAETQRLLGRPIKDQVEVSASGRIRQTALHAAQVERLMRDGDTLIARHVPGSFLEFISRDCLEDGSLDLAFDAQNAQGIFKMTDGAAA